MAIICELKCGETQKRKMVARLIASIYNAVHSLPSSPSPSPSIYNNPNLIGNVIRMALPTSSVEDSSAEDPRDDCTDWIVRLLTLFLSPHECPYPMIHRKLSDTVITGGGIGRGAKAGAKPQQNCILFRLPT